MVVNYNIIIYQLVRCPPDIFVILTLTYYLYYISILVNDIRDHINYCINNVICSIEFLYSCLTNFSTAATNLYNILIKYADTDKLVYTSNY